MILALVVLKTKEVCPDWAQYICGEFSCIWHPAVNVTFSSCSAAQSGRWYPSERVSCVTELTLDCRRNYADLRVGARCEISIERKKEIVQNTSAAWFFHSVRQWLTHSLVLTFLSLRDSSYSSTRQLIKHSDSCRLQRVQPPFSLLFPGAQTNLMAVVHKHTYSFHTGNIWLLSLMCSLAGSYCGRTRPDPFLVTGERHVTSL